MSFILKVSYVLLIFLFSLKYQLVWSQNRIIGGREMEIEKVPYTLALFIPLLNGGTSLCGASIIDKKWALTAAHCFENSKLDEISVIAGTANLKQRAKTSKTFHITEYHNHEHYDNKTQANDIAVFKVKPPFTYNSAIKPVKLPEKGKPLNDSWGFVSGWGITKRGGVISPKLFSVKVPKVSNEMCKKIFSRLNLTLSSGAICYGYFGQSIIKDACQGDSGGPLVNMKSILTAIVSWGLECGLPFPGIYTKVLYYRDWIKEKTGI